MEHPNVDSTTIDTLTTITINRPDRANALTSSMLVALTDAVQAAHQSSVLILTGAGRVFSAGADLDHLNDGLATDPAWEHLSRAVADHAGLTVAYLNGTVAGGAMGMVLACDLRVAVPNAKFFYPVLANKVDPQPSDPMRMAQIIGSSRAVGFFCLGEKISAQTALAWGLLNHVAEKPELDQWVADQLQVPQAAGQPAVQRIKSMIYDQSATKTPDT